MQTDSTHSLHVCLVLDQVNSSWIIGKIAERLAEHLPSFGVTVEISDHPLPHAVINHWMTYSLPWAYYKQDRAFKPNTNSTMLVTHVDDSIKLQVLKEDLRGLVNIGICMSRMTVEDLVRHGVDRNRLCYILPAHDSRVQPRRIIIGITSKVFADRRKREYLLVDLANSMRLDAFHFEIIGTGWDEVIPHLEAAGATVRYHCLTGDHKMDYLVTLDRIPTFDYYLYTGLDEGSMGTLDALAAGVATIITPQGFHLDVDSAITRPFWDGPQLRAVFETIARERQARIDGVRHLTWSNYARQHGLVWRAMLDGQRHDISSLLHPASDCTNPLPRRSLLDNVISKVRFYDNARQSDCLRAYVNHWISKSRIRLALFRCARTIWRLRKFLHKRVPARSLTQVGGDGKSS